jgi:hypothetical protein
MNFLGPTAFQISQSNIFPIGVVARQGAKRVGQGLRLSYDGRNACGVALFLAVEHLGGRVERRHAVKDNILVELVPGHRGRYAVTPRLAR